MKTSLLLFLSILLITVFSHSAFAQNDRINPPRLAVKWSPFHLLYFYPSAQFALEHKLANKFTLSYEMGWMLNYPDNDSEDYSKRSGFRGLAELRYYLPSPRMVPFYLAGEYYYHDIRFNRSSVQGYECASGQCDYFEYITYKVQTHQQGVGLKFGVLLFPGWKTNKSFFFDLQAGFAYRTIRYKDVGIPEVPNSRMFENNKATLFAPSEKNRTEPRPVIGIRVGYRIL